MPTNLSEVSTKNLSLILEMIFALRPSLISRPFYCLESLGMKSGFLAETTGSSSIIFPLNSY